MKRKLLAMVLAVVMIMSYAAPNVEVQAEEVQAEGTQTTGVPFGGGMVPMDESGDYSTVYTSRTTDFEKSGDSYTAPSEELVMASDPWDGTADTAWYDEKKTEYDISAPEQLAGLAELVNSGNTFEGKKISLTKDIFLNDESYSHTWIPIAKNDAESNGGGNVFQGTFNGNGYTVYNMSTDSTLDGGLFGYIGEQGIVKAVNISQGYLYSGGCIANLNDGIISFCSNYSCTGADDLSFVGGICNVNYNLVYGCKNYGEVWGKSTGGIVGKNSRNLAVVSQCSNEGTVEGSNDAAGIANYNYGWIYNCYNKGIIADSYPGNINRGNCLCGIVCGSSREAHATVVENCYSAGTFSYSTDTWMLGVCPITWGYSNEYVANCYAVSSDADDSDTTVTYEEMQSMDFLKKLDDQKRTVFSAWMEDASGMNQGMPITVADYNSSIGKYKVQPELWIRTGDITINMDDKDYRLGIECYYNESEPVITIADTDIAQIMRGDDGWSIKPLKSGTTQMQIHFDETENNVSADYQCNIIVSSNPGENPGENPVEDPGENPVEDPEKNPSEDPGENPDNDREEKKKSVKQAKVTLATATCAYTGKAQKPKVTSVKLGNTALTLDKDYTVSYKNNTNIGTATVIITGKGNYTGTAAKTFTISAKKGSSFTVGAYKYKITGSSTAAFTGLKSSKTTKVTIPKTVKIGGKTFKVTTVANNALKKQKKVTSITIGANVTSIGTSAFEGCSKLSKVAIGNNVTKIGANAFKNCKKLGTITIKSTKLKSVGKNAFKGIKSNTKIKVPAKKLNAYKKLLKGKGQGKKVKIVK